MARGVTRKTAKSAKAVRKAAARPPAKTVRKKTTIYIQAELLRAAKVAAAQSGRREYEILEDALKRYLGRAALDSMWSRNDMSAEDASSLVSEALRSIRRARRVPAGRQKA